MARLLALISLLLLVTLVQSYSQTARDPVESKQILPHRDGWEHHRYVYSHVIFDSHLNIHYHVTFDSHVIITWHSVLFL